MGIADVKALLGRGEICLGAWAGVPHPIVAEAMASLGFHWLAMDLEHATADLDQVTACFMAAERHGCAPFVRLPSADPFLARRLLDAGARGLIVPVVESADDFTAFIRHTLYPPAGRRGVGLSRCNLWGDHFQSYLTGFAPVLVPQIETARGAAAAAAIAALPDVDALFLGPYDLSADLGAAGDFSGTAFMEAAKSVREACAAAGKAVGIHQVAPDPVELKRRVAEGYRFIAYSTDVIALRSALGRPLQILKED